MSSWKKVFLSIFSGLLLAFIFPKFDQFYLAWFALIPLFLVLYSLSSFRQALAYGFLSGFVFFGLFFYWASLFGRLAWTSITVYHSFYFALFALGAAFLIKRLSFWPRLFLVPAWLVSIELFRSVGWWGFSWGSLGYSQQADPNIRMLASYAGVFGLSYLITLVNVFLTESVVSWRNPEARPRTSISWSFYSIVIVVLVFVYLGLFGLRLGLENEQGNGSGFLKVAALQGNIPQAEKFDSAKTEEVKRLFLKMSIEAAENDADLIVWPESSYPGYLQDDLDFTNRLQRLSDSYQSSLIVGSFYYDETEDRYYNSAYLFQPGKKPARYDKVNIVPFGEYVPFRPLLGWIKALRVIQTDLSAFPKLKLLPAPGGTIGSGICFESSNPCLCRQMVAKGAGLLVFITNDAWFEKTAASYQHLQTTAMRSIENGVYALQAANTGISAIISSNGAIEQETRLEERSILYGRTRFLKRPTFYVRFGFIFPCLCFVISIASLVRCSLARFSRA